MVVYWSCFVSFSKLRAFFKSVFFGEGLFGVVDTSQTKPNDSFVAQPPSHSQPPWHPFPSQPLRDVNHLWWQPQCVGGKGFEAQSKNISVPGLSGFSCLSQKGRLRFFYKQWNEISTNQSSLGDFLGCLLAFPVFCGFLILPNLPACFACALLALLVCYFEVLLFAVSASSPLGKNTTKLHLRRVDTFWFRINNLQNSSSLRTYLSQTVRLVVSYHFGPMKPLLTGESRTKSWIRQASSQRCSLSDASPRLRPPNRFGQHEWSVV